MSRRRLIRNPVGAWINLGLLGSQGTITAPAGPYSINVSYVFSMTAGLASYDWQRETGMTILSGIGTNEITVQFTEPGIRTVRCDARDSNGTNILAAWIDTVGTAPPYSPSLDFSDARNSMYVAMGL